MFKRRLLLYVLVLSVGRGWGQVNIGGFIENKVNGAKDKAKSKIKARTIENWEKKRAEYDESNFNYAISFLDNSGVFEAEEKGNSFSSTALNTLKLLNNEEKTTEERAYTSLKNGEILMAGNQFNLAEQSFKQAKNLYTQDGKTLSPNYAQTISNLGLLYQSQGLYSKAKFYNEEAIVLREATENKGMFIVSINNNAVLKKELGFYTEAESDLLNVLSMAGGRKDTMALALINNNLAMTYLEMNKLKASEKYMLESIFNAVLVLKENANNLTKLKINLSNIYRLQKKYSEAETIYLRAIEIKEKKLGAHPDLAHLKKGLAQLYMEMKRPAEAEKLLVSAFDINKRKLGESHPATISTQQELANFYRYNNNPVKSLELITKVVEKKKIIYGEEHPNFIQALEDMALTQWQNNKIEGAETAYLTVIQNTLKYINSYFNSLNDNEKTLYWDKANTRLQRFYNFAYTNSYSNKALLTNMYNTSINTKGFLLNNSSKIRNIISSCNDESLKATYNNWLDSKEHLNVAFQLSKEELAQQKINVDSLKNSAEMLERELSIKSSLFKEGNNSEILELSTIQKQLDSTEAAVEIIEINEFKNGFTGNAFYIAIIIKSTEIKLMNLGDDQSIAKAVSEFRIKTINQKPENEAYALTWSVVDAELGGIKKVYLSLDGIYHQLSIIALKDSQGKFMADKYSIQLLGNTRDVVSVKKNKNDAIKPISAFLIGNPPMINKEP
ncbi:MAG: tetratricopeptide repeat protein [Bacteroidetes bacterium]|nr:tetratricopeptide repeat protein [Bacteroidota bacterium]